MKKKVLLFFATAMLSIMGAKADVIPSSYYSTVGEGTYYIYDVTDQTFIGRETNRITFETLPTKTFTLASGENSGYTIKYDATSTYMVYNRAGWGAGWGSDFWMDANGVKDEGEGQYAAWNFTDVNTKTYTISTTYSYKGSTNNTGGIAKYLQGGVWSTETAASAHEYALITVANYNAYLEAQTYNGYAATASIPATYFTTTPVAGNIYYLYSPYASCFLYATADHAGLQNIPAAITFTANGDDFNILFSSNSKYLKYDAVKQGNTWVNGNDPVAWKFESFHGATGLFFVKTLISETYQYLYAKTTEANTWGGECWPTPETGNTRYAWALISEANYTAWQNSFTLNESTDFSIARDIYNVNPTVTKSMTAGVWNTFVVPFDMAIPSGWTVKEPTAFDGSTLTFGDASSIVAGKPYIVKPTEAVTSFSATGVTLKKDLNNTTLGDLTMTGTYEQIAAIDYSTQDSYVIGIKNGVSSLYRVNSSVSLKPFRAYFTVEGGPAARIALSFDNEATGISDVRGKTEGVRDVYYDMQGRRVAQPTKGLYIVNGKKVMIK